MKTLLDFHVCWLFLLDNSASNPTLCLPPFNGAILPFVESYVSDTPISFPIP